MIVKLFNLDPKEREAVKIFIVGTVFSIAVLTIIFFTSLFSPHPAHASDMSRQEMGEDTTELRAIIRAYNHLLHRIWIDKPNYVEDVLNESDEFIELNDLLYSKWEDTFRFYNKEDSLRYHYNWIHEGDCIHMLPVGSLEEFIEDETE